MLLAALDASGAQRGGDAIDRASQALGKPKLAVRLAGGAIGGWDCAAGVYADQGQARLVEGCLHLGNAELSPRSLQDATGDFTLFALHEHGVLLASGRAGGCRPVYVTWPSPELVLACTRLSPLLALLPQLPPLDLEYLSASLVSHGPKPAESTPYVGVRRVPLGEAWLVRPGTQQHRWPTVAPLLGRELRDDEDLAVLLRQAIMDATRRSARNAARLGLEVSGGLDSSMLLSLLASLAHSGELPAPPVAFAYEAAAPAWHDDRPHLRALESHLDLCAHRIIPGDAAAFVHQLMVVDSMPAPSTMLSTATALGSVARAYGIDVVLTGDGGDQVLDGNPRLFAELARRGEIRRAFNGALRTRGVFYEGNLGRLSRFILRPLVEPLLPRSVGRALRSHRRIPRWAGPVLASSIRGSPMSEETPIRLLEELPGERYARLLRWPAFGPWSLMRLQEEVVGGYTLRSPLLDDEFLRFAATIPPLSLMRGGFLRGLMREAMTGLVPEALRLRETKGTFYFFVEKALEKAGGLDVLESLANVRMLADLRLVEPKRFREFFDAFRRAPNDGANHTDAWRVLSVEAFLRERVAKSPMGLA